MYPRISRPHVDGIGGRAFDRPNLEACGGASGRVGGADAVEHNFEAHESAWDRHPIDAAP